MAVALAAALAAALVQAVAAAPAALDLVLAAAALEAPVAPVVHLSSPEMPMTASTDIFRNETVSIFCEPFLLRP